MPAPVISHIIGTVTLLAIALTLVEVFSFVAFVYNMETVNVMLSEVAESCAREIVELVSVHTLGGGEYTVMLLRVPDDLGGQPYVLQVSDVAENKLLVNASLQIYQQVRVVVTPNFGTNPVRAVSTDTQVSQGIVAKPRIFLPLPQGYRPALIVFRQGDYLYVGFTEIPRG